MNEDEASKYAPNDSATIKLLLDTGANRDIKDKVYIIKKVDR